MKKRLKICSPQLGLNPKSDLGGEIHDHFLLKGLAKRENKIFVYLPKGRFYEKNKNIKVSRVPFKHIPAFAFNLLVIPYLFKVYKKEHFDILRVHNPYFLGLGALFFKTFNPKVAVVSTHHLKEDSFLFNLINRFTINKYDHIICVSNYLKDWIINNYGVDSRKVSVIYNGVDPELKPKPKNRFLVKKFNLSNKIVIVTMGLFIERKNPLFLLKVYKRLRKKYQGLSLLFFGRGPLKNKMLDFIKKEKIKDVHIIDAVFGEDKMEAINLSDIFVLPSKSEGFGLVIAEAMRCKKPVVVSDNTSICEVIDDKKNGLLAKTSDKENWYEKLSKLIIDEKLRKIIGKNGQLRAKKEFSWDKHIKTYENVFYNLLKND